MHSSEKMCHYYPSLHACIGESPLISLSNLKFTENVIARSKIIFIYLFICLMTLIHLIILYLIISMMAFIYLTKLCLCIFHIHVLHISIPIGRKLFSAPLCNSCFNYR